MPKVTQNYKLWTLLQSGESVTVATIQESLGIGQYSVPVYIHELKRIYKADIESVRDGRKVVGYKLLNKIKVPEYRTNNAQYVAKVKEEPVADGAVPLLDADNELTQIGEDEMNDIRDSLGIDGTGIIGD
jgi:biotin operon repressor